MLKKIVNLRSAILVFTIVFTIILISNDTRNTFSWFQGSDSKQNHFESPQRELQIEVIDEFIPPGGYDPGETINKKVGAKNIGTLPAFVRLMIFPTIISSDGETPLPANIGKEVIFPDPDSSQWMYGEDGYYYYLDVLQPGDSTKTSLFTEVKIADNLGKEYNGSHLKIEVKAEGALITKYKYREAFWKIEQIDPQGNPPGNEPLITIDKILEGKAK